MSSRDALHFPLPTELLKTWSDSFQSRYTTALNMRDAWKTASIHVSFGKWGSLNHLPDMLNLAWIGEWRDILFSGRGYFKTPADLRTLAFALREMQGSEPLGIELDRTPKDFLLLELPETISSHYHLNAIPSVDDFCEATGMSRAEVLFEANSLRISDFARRLNKSIQENRLSDEACVWIGKLLRFETFHDVNWNDPDFNRKECPELPEWRRNLLQFCRDAVLELAFRSYVVDPLPGLYYSEDLPQEIINDLILRANEADRRSFANQSDPHSKIEGSVAAGASHELTADLRGTPEAEEKELGHLPGPERPVWVDVFGLYRIEAYRLVLIETSLGIEITPGEKRALEALVAAGKDGFRLKDLAAPWPSFRTHVSRIKAKLKGDNICDCIRTPEEPGPFTGEGYTIWPG